MKVRIKRALISVSNKEGIVDFAKTLEETGVEIISTGGTYRKLEESGIKVKKVEEVTGFPEMLNGRVKTLHPYIHGGILADRSNENHMNEVSNSKIKLIDMVVVNLYPFKETISRANVTMEEAIENIDIGGPTMIRSAAKNYKGVAVVVDPDDYKKIQAELKDSGGYISLGTLFRLSVKAFQHTCEYDSVIFNYLKNKTGSFDNSDISIRDYLDIDCSSAGKEMEDNFRYSDGNFKDSLGLNLKKIQNLRYGENPHQKASYYKYIDTGADNFAGARQLQGKELSYNNILDGNAAFGIVKEFATPCVAVIKHNNPCGAAAAQSVEEAYKKAYQCDPVSAFGSVVACNMEWTAEAAKFMLDKYVEVLIAPDFDQQALKILAERQNLRILKMDFELNTYIDSINSDDFKLEKVDIKSVDGGLLVQDLDEGPDSKKDMKVVTSVEPDPAKWNDLLFGWQIVKSVKSNAIVLAANNSTVGIGAGQMSRIDAAEIAIRKSNGRCKNSIMASDAFFPFEDVAELAAKNGITAIIQPGGSIRDKEVIESCNKNKIPMVFTGKRHFRH
ncbi:MAG: bifunctional phosphoribosylaminoimidazolecarboxamide formyltransferase/IMP cyclohydrolase [Actinobacteria bacterium]|nr:MAG: bifunctional phosphoribosylaminoimidazolecarboxamide formyltransferase/IMP cyclohydrolase [Actinomycetota bacterium]